MKPRNKKERLKNEEGKQKQKKKANLDNLKRIRSNSAGAAHKTTSIHNIRI